MSLLQIKQQVGKLSPEERRELNAYLVRLRNESEEGRNKIDWRMTAMDQGHQVSADELEKRIATRHGERL
jgi:hypothetical protein